MGIFDKLFGKKNEKTIWDAKMPLCSLCGLNTDQVLVRNKAKNPNTVYVGNLVGVCPICRKSFCINHAPYDYSVDCAICPTDKKELDFWWDNKPSVDKPWRIGAPPKEELEKKESI